LAISSERPSLMDVPRRGDTPRPNGPGHLAGAVSLWAAMANRRCRPARHDRRTAGKPDGSAAAGIDSSSLGGSAHAGAHGPVPRLRRGCVDRRPRGSGCCHALSALLDSGGPILGGVPPRVSSPGPTAPVSRPGLCLVCGDDSAGVSPSAREMSDGVPVLAGATYSVGAPRRGDTPRPDVPRHPTGAVALLRRGADWPRLASVREVQAHSLRNMRTLRCAYCAEAVA